MTKIIANGEAKEFENYCYKYDNAGVTSPHVSFKERSFYQWLLANRGSIKGSDIILMNLHSSPINVRRSSQFGPIAEHLIDECGLSSNSFKPVYTAWELYRKLRGEDIHESDSVPDGAQQ